MSYLPPPDIAAGAFVAIGFAFCFLWGWFSGWRERRAEDNADGANGDLLTPQERHELRHGITRRPGPGPAKDWRLENGTKEWRSGRR